MRILLDTHVVLWALEDSPYLTTPIKEMICDEKNEVYISAASLWEISIKHKKNPEKMPFSAQQIRDYCQRAGYIFLSLGIDSVITYDSLDLSIHQDPFDQILVCQATNNNMLFLTHDKKISEYNLPCIKLF